MRSREHHVPSSSLRACPERSRTGQAFAPAAAWKRLFVPPHFRLRRTCGEENKKRTALPHSAALRACPERSRRGKLRRKGELTIPPCKSCSMVCKAPRWEPCLRVSWCDAPASHCGKNRGYHSLPPYTGLAPLAYIDRALVGIQA